MSLRDVPLKRSYDSDDDDILSDFYIPALKESVRYNRLTGFFSSSSLALAARGLTEFVKNEGQMRLVAGAKLREADIKAIQEGSLSPERAIEKFMNDELETLEDGFIKDHVKALGWMIANGNLEIKIAIVHDQGGSPLDYQTVNKMAIFHQKVGIMEDAEGNQIAFSGSWNESALGLTTHIESFKVYRNWVPEQKGYLEDDVTMFDKFWNGIPKRTTVIDVPDAVERKLVEIAPENFDDINLGKWINGNATEEQEIKLWEIQKKGRDEWFKNGKTGILRMATGSGKTYAALGCLEKLMTQNETNLLTIIVCPTGPLVKQWKENLEEFGIEDKTVIADSSNAGWKNELADDIVDLNIGSAERLIVLTTFNSFSSDDFINIIGTCRSQSCLIVDEVHGIGAPKRKEGLLDSYDFRLGLSATPRRWYDEEGTEEIFDYFGGVILKFPLKRAINEINPDTGETYLTQYDYKPHFVGLTDSELIDYMENTKKISKTYYQSQNDEEKEEIFNLLCIKRQNIVKNATNKYRKFEEILENVNDLKHCLIYCSPQQIEAVKRILDENNIIWHEFTQEEGIKSEEKYGGLSERQFLLREFSKTTYQVLVAMKILDEGIDVPPARIGIMLCSTGNPRQYIQRRGRILRHAPGKKKAVIHDIIVIPGITTEGSTSLSDLEKQILKKELRRYREFADAAENRLECLKEIDKIEEKFDINLWV